jgi:hypothetical protein
VAVFALIAAIFWFLSAGESPPMVTYWGSTPDADPFYKAVKFSAEMNKLAAGFSGPIRLAHGSCSWV